MATRLRGVPMNPIPVSEVMTFLNERSTIGRVVINPPEKMATLETHRTGESWYFCYVCGRSTLDQNKHLKHIKEHNGNANVFTYPTNLDTTPRTPNRISRYTNHFGQSERDSEDDDSRLINLYVKKHSQTEKHICCRLCNVNFPRMASLRAHMADCHADDEGHAQCRHCHEVFRKPSLKQHIQRNHNPDDPFKCSHCNTRKSTMLGLHKHVSISHPKLFKPSRGIQKRDAKRAIPQDSPITESTGSESSVKSYAELSRNSRIPETSEALQDNILYRCKKCQKTFLTLGSLRKHFQVHAEESEIRCGLCSRLFRLQNTLDKHMEVAHTNGRYQCPYCPCRFELPKGIQTHVQLRHAEEGSDDPTFRP